MESTIENGTKRKRRSKFDIPPEQMPQFATTISTGDSDSGIVKRKSNFDVPPDSINSLAADNFLKFAMTPSLMQDQFEVDRKDRLALNPAAAPVSNVTGTSVFGFSAQTVAPKKASSVPSSKSGIGAVNQINRQRQEMNSIYVAGLPKDMTESDLEILFSVHGKLKRVKMYTHPDGSRKGDALITFNRPEAVRVACHQYNGRDIGGGYILSVSRADFGASDTSSAPANAKSGGVNDNNSAAVNFDQGEHLQSIQQSDCSNTVTDSIEAVVQALPQESEGGVWPIALLRNVYDPMDPNITAEFFIDLEADLLEECCKMGRVRTLTTPDHPSLVGSVAVTFQEESAARTCFVKLNNRSFDGRLVNVQLLLSSGSTVIEKQPEPAAAESIAVQSSITLQDSVPAEVVEEAAQDVENFLNSLL